MLIQRLQTVEYINPNLSLSPTSYKPKNPTPLQKTIYDFHASRQFQSHNRHHSMADDIYSPIWFERSVFFAENETREAEDELEADVRDELDLQNFTLATLFMTSPVPAYALWNVLQAFHELDECVIYGPKLNTNTKMQIQHVAKPVTYLQNNEVTDSFAQGLSELKRDIESGILAGENLLRKLGGLSDALCALEGRVDELVEVLGGVDLNRGSGKENGRAFWEAILNEIEDALEERRNLIVEGLRYEDETSESDCDSDCGRENRC